jgi:hypothetical protein
MDSLTHVPPLAVLYLVPSPGWWQLCLGNEGGDGVENDNSGMKKRIGGQIEKGRMTACMKSSTDSVIDSLIQGQSVMSVSQWRTRIPGVR